MKTRRKTEPKEKPPKISFFRLFHYGSRWDKCLTIFGCICSVLAAATRISDVLAFAILGDSLIANSKDTSKNKIHPDIIPLDDAIVYYSIAMGCIAIGQVIFCYLSVVCLNTAADRQLLRIRSLFFKSVLRQDMTWFDSNHASDFANTSVENLSNLRDGIGEKLGLCVYLTSVCVVGSIIALSTGWKLALVVLSVTPVIVAITTIFTQVQANLSRDELKAYSDAGSVAEEILSSVKTVMAFGGEEKAQIQYNTQLTKAAKSCKKLRLISSIGNGFAWFLTFFGYTVAYWYGIQLVVESKQDKTYEYKPRTIFTVIFSAIVGCIHITRLGPHLECLTSAKAAAPIIYETIERVPEIDSASEGGTKPSEIKGEIQFNNVYFSYPSRPEIPILDGLSITIKQGQTIALVGSSGCGKSTCIQLLLRFYQPLRGEVSVDGKKIETLNIGWLRDQIAVVGQEPALFAMSIRDNIQLGTKKILTDAEIEIAAKAANAHEFIAKLPEKYETMLGERGAKLSGGQKQRIAIARALVKNPKILLLDEATSALDAQSEALVQQALDKASAGRTTIIVAHRLTTIKNANVIYVLHQGRVVEQGKHAELLVLNGLYVQMLKDQSHKDDDVDDFEEEDSEDSLKLQTSLSAEKLMRTSTAFLLADEFEREAAKASLKRLLQTNSSEWYLLFFGCLGSFLFGAAMPGYAVLVGEMLRILGIDDPEETLTQSRTYSSYFCIVGAGAGLGTFLQIYMFSLAGERLTMKLRKNMFNAILLQDIGWFDSDKNNTGALCSRLAVDAHNVQGATGPILGAILQTISCLVLSIILGLIYLWQQALVSISLIPLIFLGLLLESHWTQRQSSAEREALQASGKIAIETINNIKTVATLRREETFHQMYVDALSTSQKKTWIPLHIHAFLYGFVYAMLTISYIITIHYGVHLVLTKQASYENVFRVGELIVFGSILMATTVASAPSLDKGLYSAGKIFELLDRKPKIDVENKKKLPEPTLTKADVEFESIKFYYPTRPNAAVLKDFTCKIASGKTLALVGGSGCGKSTCIQILERFYDPYAGIVKLGGYDITEVSVRWLRAQLGLVSQEPTLFDCSIAQNIAYGDNSREVSMEEIINAAKKANIHNFISTLPNGYGTNVGQKGTQLSGGQKQRIAIARALVRNPKVLLLDEATSALDTESEKIVQEALDKAMVGRTSIVIAHRLSTIQNAHVIVFMQHGRIVEQGTHQTLMALRGSYYHLRRIPSKLVVMGKK